jgi:hypothetical protein
MGQRIDGDWDDIFMQAALQPDLWLAALDTLATRTGSTHGQLIGLAARAKSRSISSPISMLQ